MDAKKVFYTFAIAVISAVTGVYVYSHIVKSEPKVITIKEEVPAIGQLTANTVQASLPDLTTAAERSVHAVVHVKTRSRGKDYYSGNPFYDFFFGPGSGYRQPQQPVMGAGSGVILTTDGYIVTNNHVIDNADEIEVTLNDKRTFSATLVGADPTSDIALIKIEAEELPFVPYGDSDELKVGEWVLAVGNPFNLTSTVTAGIVSAKARSINIIANQNQTLGVESFIQTDAAVNPGNSGGALVNQRGELVGINTAIASRTGSFTGYSFAVPVTIAKKVVADLMEFGEVQRGLLGVSIIEVSNVTDELADELGVKIDKIKGVFIGSVAPNGGAEEAGLKAGDIILSVNGEDVNSVPELQERVSMHRPGEKVNIIALRDGKQKPFEVTLRNIRGTTGIISSSKIDETLGATLEPVSASDLRRLGVRYGIQVVEVGNESLRKSGVKNGFIITKVNDTPIKSIDDFKAAVEKAKDGLFLTGVYPNGRVVYYAVNLND
ncbi:Do family serine endopeptidase [Carboxylicivirga sediminis]|uniref:Do family serine endopeptidase n=1 Tax=Carboxylicivirga sediminis TaxID=2006564 RepID=A0A941F417_9BACT|nr:Do family serine endopeptidase [Carboxylicivirga sediminis]MBR8534890.1 Do family serine endopeptidase [Carboxylicivirga sediminis]